MKTEKIASYSLLFMCFNQEHLWSTRIGSAASHKPPDKNKDEISGLINSLEIWSTLWNLIP